jgi:hypothetical protein
MLSQPLEQMVAPYLWIECFVFSITCLDISTLDCLNKFVHNPWYDGGSRVEGCFHNIYEHWVSHNIEGDVRLIK